MKLHPEFLDAVKQKQIDDVIYSPAPTLHVFPFLHPDFCRHLIDVAEQGEFAPEEGDPAPGAEQRLRGDLYEEFSQVTAQWLRPLAEVLYGGAQISFLEPPFIVKYTMDSQREMIRHEDKQSDVSLTVNLNATYLGGGVTFCESGFNTSELPIGYAVMFLGRFTPHQAEPITRGVRYGLTLWTRVEADEYCEPCDEESGLFTPAGIDKLIEQDNN